MNSVIVTVKCKNKKDTRDLELPTDIPAKHLSSLIAYALRLDDDLTSVTSSFICMPSPWDGFSGMTKHWKTPVYGRFYSNNSIIVINPQSCCIQYHNISIDNNTK